jgi:hypothetical membrane protein
LLAARTYESYDWQSQLASELGTIGCASSAVFNTGIVLSGLAALASAIGFKLGLKQIGVNRAFRGLIATTVVSSGGASVWAGLHPLPSPIHNPGYWGIGTVAFPLLLAAAVRCSPMSPALRFYLVGTAIAIIAFLFIFLGGARMDLLPYDGAMQRLGALLVYSPMAVVAIAILRIDQAGTIGARKVQHG